MKERRGRPPKQNEKATWFVPFSYCLFLIHQIRSRSAGIRLVMKRNDCPRGERSQCRRQRDWTDDAELPGKIVEWIRGVAHERRRGRMAGFDHPELDLVRS